MLILPNILNREIIWAILKKHGSSKDLKDKGLTRTRIHPAPPPSDPGVIRTSLPPWPLGEHVEGAGSEDGAVEEFVQEPPGVGAVAAGARLGSPRHQEGGGGGPASKSPACCFGLANYWAKGHRGGVRGEVQEDAWGRRHRWPWLTTNLVWPPAVQKRDGLDEEGSRPPHKMFRGRGGSRGCKRCHLGSDLSSPQGGRAPSASRGGPRSR